MSQEGFEYRQTLLAFGRCSLSDLMEDWVEELQESLGKEKARGVRDLRDAEVPSHGQLISQCSAIQFPTGCFSLQS